MIYLDNAATTMVKPQCVVDAVCAAMTHFGGAGRGVHGASLEAGMAIYEARAALAELFGAPSAAHVSFTANATESLNTIISGLVGAGAAGNAGAAGAGADGGASVNAAANTGVHVITTAASHNSVLRPLYRAQAAGAQLTIVPIEPDGTLDLGKFEAAFAIPTKLVVVTHASNVTGNIYDVAAMARVAHAHGALMCVDAAQTAGVLDIDMSRDGIDILAFTGHKSLYGPQGTGGICVGEGVEIPPFKVGGSGSHSFDKQHPRAMPEGLEAGTLNGHGIAGLAAGVRWLTGLESAAQAGAASEQDGDAKAGAAFATTAAGAEVCALANAFAIRASQIEGVRILGPAPGAPRCGIVALNVGDVDSALVADALNFEAGICTRAGAHCAPLMHKALDTDGQGVVRFSFSHFNTAADVDAAVSALEKIASELG